MTDADQSASPDSLLEQPPEISRQIAALRLAGAGQFDPVGLHYLQVLADRASAQPEPVKRLLDDKLAHALAALKARLLAAQGEAHEAIARMAPNHPQAVADLQRRFATGDYRGVQRTIADLKTGAPGTALGELLKHLAQQAPAQADTGLEGDVSTAPGARPELKTMRYFRNTWSKLSVDKQVTQALHQAPKNAGPINSHLLVLRSLALMRDISPDYLNRFTSYIDTLLCLDHCDKAKQAVAKKAAEGDAGIKKKPRRARSK
jgi:Protein of unknown function (DUF2894)